MTDWWLRERRHQHIWTSKPAYPELGEFCIECGKPKPKTRPQDALALVEHKARR